MSRLRSFKTNFTAGALSPRLLGRGDLSAYQNGARTLVNVAIHPTGGVSRRKGLRHVGMLPGPGRLIAFEFNTEQIYLVVATAGKLAIRSGGEEIAILDAPWSTGQIPGLSWTQSADTLLLTHPDTAPRKLIRKAALEWELKEWSFYEKDGALFCPWHKFAEDEVTLAASATSGTVTLTASAAVFEASHVGTRMRIAARQVEITAVAGPTSATALVKQSLSGTAATKDWEEQAFSPVRGWPVSACFHQDRLVIGGSRDLPNRLWMSKSADLFNFDLGEALDDEAIEFAILSDQVNAIRAVFSGRHLQVFTSGAEWMVTGDPLTPANVQLNRQTRIGSPTDRSVPPRDVDGATLFVSRDGRSLREYLFTDVEQAYQSNDLAVLTDGMVEDPFDQDFDQAERLLYLVLGSGVLSCVTVYRAEKVTAWVRHQTDGNVLSVAVAGPDTWLIVERFGSHRLERFEASLFTDAAMTAELEADAEPVTLWSGLDHLEGQHVQVLADGIHRGTRIVLDGAIELEEPAARVEIGLPFAHVIEPLPLHLAGVEGGAQDMAVRLVRASFRLLDTEAMLVDVGRGLTSVPFRRFGDDLTGEGKASPFTGDKTVRALGWRRNAIDPLWRVDQDLPVRCTILSVLTEITVNGG